MTTTDPDVSPTDPAGNPLWELQRQHRRLAALAEIDLVDVSLGEVLRRISQVTTELLPADRGASVVLWDPVTERFSLAESSVPGQEDIQPAERVRRQGGASRWIVDNRMPVSVEDVSSDPFGTSNLADEYGVRAYMGVPIVAENKAVGVLYALASTPRKWSEAEKDFLMVLARRAAAAIVTARLIDDAREARERAEALSHISNALIGLSSLPEVLQTIVDGVAGVFDAEQVSLVTLDFDAQRVVDHVAGGMGRSLAEVKSFDQLMDGETGTAVRNSATVVLPSAPSGSSGAAMVAPLVYQSRMLGSLTVLRRPDQPDFTSDDVGLISVMAGQASVAIHTAQLSAETEEALAELSAVFEIVKAQNTEQGLDELLASLTQAAAGAIPASRVALVLVDLVAGVVERVMAGGPHRDEVNRELPFSELWEGLSGWVIRNRRPAVSVGLDPRESPLVQRRRIETGAGPIMVVPLFDRGSVIGTLTAINETDGDHFSQRDVEMASIMATQMSVAIANAKLFDETQRLAVTDELTGVHNRRHLFTLGEREVALARRYGRALCGIMFDIDNFKRVNDSYGHAVGDEVLRVVADRCRGAVRDVDVLGRYGGEEFAVILPETVLDGAVEIAERLRSAVGSRPIQTTVGGLPVTVSVGVTEMTPQMHDVHALLDHADAAMLFAKRLGRNRVQAG